jgi:glycosyltransferase involved in cell wall biosynthesis
MLAAQALQGVLYVSSDGRGTLESAGIPIRRYWYRRMQYRVLTLGTYLASQVCLFVKLLADRSIDPAATVYVNTLLPFGAAIYGRLTGRRVIYHLHEISVTPAPLRWFLLAVTRYTAAQLIYVSEFHRSCLRVADIPSCTIYNALDRAFAGRAAGSAYMHRHAGIFRVLMLASLRPYKGTPEFLALARRLSDRSDIAFELVCNDDAGAISRFTANHDVPPNVILHAATSDAAAHYARASVVLNLSRPDAWVETFGMTLLEAMAFGIPVIAPPVGGPVELVDDGKEGFLIDSRNGEELVTRIAYLADHPEVCDGMSASARRKSARFSAAESARRLLGALTGLDGRPGSRDAAAEEITTRGNAR